MIRHPSLPTFIAKQRPSSLPWLLELVNSSFYLCAQRFKSGNHVKQFLVDATLTHNVECAVEILQQFVDVFIGALHRARRLAFSLARDSARRSKERDEKILADEHTQSPGATAHDLGQGLRRPGDVGQTLLPRRVERQQPLATVVQSPGLRTVMEDINTRILAFGTMRFAFDLNLSTSGVMACTECAPRRVPSWQASVRQARMNALADRPDFGFSGQRCESLNRIIGHHVVKLAHKSLIGSKHDCTDSACLGLSFPRYHQGRWLAYPKAHAQTSSTVR